MKTTFELIELYFNSVKSEVMEITDYTINGSIIKITYKRYVEWITKEGKDESWWNYDNYIEVELLDYITFLFNLKNKYNE
jgi:hypothetical protein